VTLETAVVFLAAFCMMALAASAAVGAAVALGDRRLAHVAPAAQSRLLLVAALAPAGVVSSVVVALIVDATVLGCRVHLCLHPHGAGWPRFLTLVVAMAGTCGMLFDLGRVARRSCGATRLERALARISPQAADGVRILPIDEPEAFVLGILRPRIYVSRGLLEHAGAVDVRSVLEHEKAHVRRRDPLRRAIASLGLACHAPGIASLIRRRLARAQEMSADAEAARTAGASATAEALVRLARLRRTRPGLAAGALAAVGTDLEARVQALLSSEPRSTALGARTITAAAAALAGLALGGAHQLHTGFEALIALLR
jgi:Zn-dependent protease with chaperone function